ncbi:hypothetical protein MF271_19785 (plasmid) [Deinococcus sp. KNUC1210]|uniref:hypothetical protein n=1 Tax=Deinococcus sp. KNUC1210 TaxID=2917691 RepID=UPI001EF0DFC6|nr:hypothetical protein [Deinococcus sp. KNUC1210]ULH17656.1 hypothetical protein MF271_19785 [Deinococcus sp. KNUC1210]
MSFSPVARNLAEYTAPKLPDQQARHLQADGKQTAISVGVTALTLQNKRSQFFNTPTNDFTLSEIPSPS